MLARLSLQQQDAEVGPRFSPLANGLLYPRGEAHHEIVCTTLTFTYTMCDKQPEVQGRCQ